MSSVAHLFEHLSIFLKLCGHIDAVTFRIFVNRRAIFFDRVSEPSAIQWIASSVLAGPFRTLWCLRGLGRLSWILCVTSSLFCLQSFLGLVRLSLGYVLRWYLWNDFLYNDCVLRNRVILATRGAIWLESGHFWVLST